VFDVARLYTAKLAPAAANAAAARDPQPASSCGGNEAVQGTAESTQEAVVPAEGVELPAVATATGRLTPDMDVSDVDADRTPRE